MVELSAVLDQDDMNFLRTYLEKHYYYTGSTLAQNILDNWHAYLPKFIRVLPLEYKRVLQEQKLAEIDHQLMYIRKEAQLEGRY
jgi:glutamate synthase (NADPH/NADH) large chain